VVGGGPAGGMAAWRLAPHCRVLVLERARLPREKLCSGVVTAKTVALLAGAIDLDATLIGTSAEVRVTHRGHGAPMALRKPLLFVSRPRMDEALLAAAGRRGAEVAEGERVTGVDPEGATVTLASGRTLRARAVIGADGAGGVCGRAVGKPSQLGVAVEARVPDPRGSGPRPALIEAALPGGYLWAFPKADGTVAVGAGTLDGSLQPRLRERVAAWSRAVLDTAVPARMPGHLLAFRPPRRLQRGRLLLAGDAAGMMDPLLGEGIPYALWSGRLAADHVLAWLGGRAPLQRYARALTPVLRWRRPYELLSLRADAVRRIMAIPAATRIGWRWLVDRAPGGVGA
jgi:geranylgeranyl reductase family protein